MMKPITAIHIDSGRTGGRKSMVDRMKRRVPLRPRVELHIDELVLDAYPRGRADTLGVDVQKELARRLDIGAADLTNEDAVATFVTDTLAQMARKGEI